MLNNYNSQQMNTTNIIAELLTSYLGFSSAELFLPNTDPIIFGGCLRDSLAGTAFTDIDIIGHNQTLNILGASLEKKGFKYERPTASDYKEMPEFNLHRFTLLQRNISIDIIKPRIKDFSDHQIELSPSEIKDSMLKFIKNVDIRACAIGYSIKGGIMELIPGALEDCLTKTIVSLPDGKLHHPSRHKLRIEKLLHKGWHANPHTEKVDLNITGYNF